MVIDQVEVGSRDSQRRVPIALRITNTTDHDIPGMQVGFVASDADGQMGPFWLPRLGSESGWAVKAGESKNVQIRAVGFGVRNLSNAKPVDVRILGENLSEVADRPESERRIIFAEKVACEDAANSEAAKKYPEDLGLPREEQLKRMGLRVEYAQPLEAACRERVRAKHQLSEKESQLISIEGIEMGWPPVGEN